MTDLENYLWGSLLFWLGKFLLLDWLGKISNDKSKGHDLLFNFCPFRSPLKMENPQILEVDGNQFEILDSTIYPHDWIVQLRPEHEQYFSSIKNKAKQFTLDRSMAGYVLKTEIHNFNLGNPQLQVQIRRSGW